jgi:hypothetical protein
MRHLSPILHAGLISKHTPTFRGTAIKLTDAEALAGREA